MTALDRSAAVSRRRWGLLAAAVAVACGLSWAPVAAGQQLGEHFGFADVEHEGGTSAPAFADNPDGKAFWAGTCDLSDRLIDGGGIGAAPGPGDPGFPFAHCVDHGRKYNPPVAAGVVPDPSSGPPGWWVGDDANSAPPADGPRWRLDPVVGAGARADAGAAFWLVRHFRSFQGAVVPDGDTKDAVVHLPAGAVGNPEAVAKCPAGENLRSVPVVCPPESQVGVLTVNLTSLNHYVVPIYNVAPRDGYTAEFIISAGEGPYRSNVPIVARARTDGDFGVDVMALKIPAGFPLLGQTVTIWGVPWAAQHDRYRAPEGYQGSVAGNEVGMPLTGLEGGVDASGRSQEPQPYRPQWGPIRPFFANPTECAPAGPVTSIDIEMWQAPFTRRSSSAAAPPVADCDKAPFEPGLELAATSPLADAPTGLRAELGLDQNELPPLARPGKFAPQGEVDDYVAAATGYWRSDAGRAAAQLEKTVVKLPAGLSVNPSGAHGLTGCADGQLGIVDAHSNPMVFDNQDPFDGRAPDCPPGSVVGTVTVHTPLLAEPLAGHVVLGQPRPADIRRPDQPLTLRTFLVVRHRQRGLLAKIAGTATTDPQTGQLTAVFERNPRLPVERVELDIAGGQRGQLATPPGCGPNPWTATLTPWTAAHDGGGSPVDTGGELATTSRCQNAFAPALVAGTTPRDGGGDATFDLHISRPDGQQWLRGLSVRLPQGLLAAVRGVPLCTDAQAGAGACPVGSRIGSVDAAAGAGDPFVLERKGDVYLTEGYKGAPYGLMIRVPVEAGPFRGQLALDTVVVRQALHVDPRTAEVTAVSDPLPHVWHGIPLRLRRAVATIDRPGFVRNPTDCAPKEIAADLASVEGATATPTVRFQAAGCADLGFEPKLRLRLTGRRQTTTGRHPGVRALVRQAGGEAGIDRARVVLPRSLALDPANARGLCEFADGSRPDPENHCPRASIVGRARAVSPLLNRPLSGPVFFVKNIRVDPRTGNEIRTLPKIVVALRGEIAVNLHGESSVDRRSRLVNTFAQVPDAPVSRFAMRIKGGRGGILAVTRTRRSTIDICARRQTALVRFDAHNRRRQARRQRIATPCPKKRHATPVKVCRQRTSTKRALRRCVAKVKRNRAKRSGPTRRARGR